MPRTTRFPIGERVVGSYVTPRIGTVVGRCNMGVHVQWDAPTRPWTAHVSRDWPELGPDYDSHNYWPGLHGAPTDNRTWYCVRRALITPA